MTPPTPSPTPLQAEQAALAQAEMLEAMDRLTREGLDWRAVLTGASTAIATVVMRNVGPAQVPAHFARMSAMTMHFANKSGG